MSAPQPDREQEIRARAEAATPGPWGIYESGSMIDIAAGLKETGCGYRARREIARLEDEPMDNDRSHAEWTEEEDWAQVQADARFIANAREDVDWLLAKNARLRAEHETWSKLGRRNLRNAQEEIDRLRADRDAAVAAAARHALEDARERIRPDVLREAATIAGELAEEFRGSGGEMAADREWGAAQVAQALFDEADPAVASPAREQGGVQPDGNESDCTCDSDDNTHDDGCPTAARWAREQTPEATR